MENCIFCKIVAGEIPCYKLYEDDEFIAFLDAFPPTEGYTLVIPKKHFRWVWDVENIGKYFEVCQKVAKNIQKVTGNESVYSMTLGEEVPHAHVRIYSAQDKKYIEKLIEFMKSNRPDKMIDSDTAKSLQSKYRLN